MLTLANHFTVKLFLSVALLMIGGSRSRCSSSEPASCPSERPNSPQGQKRTCVDLRVFGLELFFGVPCNVIYSAWSGRDGLVDSPSR